MLFSCSKFCELPVVTICVGDIQNKGRGSDY